MEDIIKEKMKYENDIQKYKELVSEVKRENSENAKRMEENYQSIIIELNEKIKNLERKHRSTLEELASADKSNHYNAQLNNQILEKEQEASNMKIMLGKFQNRFTEYAEKFSDVFKSFQYSPPKASISPNIEKLFAFVEFLLSKFESDNTWLVEKITEYEKEIEEIKDQIVLQESSERQKLRRAQEVFRKVKHITHNTYLKLNKLSFSI
jgi:hypothetical protein